MALNNTYAHTPMVAQAWEHEARHGSKRCSCSSGGRGEGAERVVRLRVVRPARHVSVPEDQHADQRLEAEAGPPCLLRVRFCALKRDR